MMTLILLQQSSECANCVNILMIQAADANQSFQSQLEAEGQEVQELIGYQTGHHAQRHPTVSSGEQEESQDYEDVFEDARREQVLQKINADNMKGNEKNQDLEDVLSNLTRREERKKEFQKNEEMKKLRQQNALEFFNKVKLHCISTFRDSIFEAKEAQNYAENKLHKLLSCLNSETLRSYHFLKSKPQNLRKRSQFEQLLSKIFKQNELSLDGNRKYSSMWSLAETLGIGFRKISFIDISDMQLQQFYNLKYSQVKGKKKKITKQIDILRNKLRRKSAEIELSHSTFVPIQSYQFNVSQHCSEQSNTNCTLATESFGSESQKAMQVRKTFKQSYCQLFCPVEQNWQLYNMEILQQHSINYAKHSVLEGRAIMGFYATKILTFNKQFRAMKELRTFGNIIFKDLTFDFCDKLQDILKRRRRLGCKSIYNAIIKQSNTFKTTLIFSQFDHLLIQKQRKEELEWAAVNFPKNAKDMRSSDYFVVPSMVDKYMIIKENAQPVPQLEFNQEKVFYKADLQPVSSRMGWIDVSRMVKDGEIPVKTTQNRNKVSTKLFTFSQTEPFKLKITDSGDFVLDEQYNSIYVPPKFDIPSQYDLIPQNVQHLCKRYKYRCARIVQGFDVAGSHVVPNNIGCLVEAVFVSQIEKLFKERQEKLKLRKESRKTEIAMTLWRKLLKSIIISQQVHGNL